MREHNSLPCYRLDVQAKLAQLSKIQKKKKCFTRFLFTFALFSSVFLTVSLRSKAIDELSASECERGRLYTTVLNPPKNTKKREF